MGASDHVNTIWSEAQVKLIVERTAHLLWELDEIDERITQLEADLPRWCHSTCH
jgi:hypothetical protein